MRYVTSFHEYHVSCRLRMTLVKIAHRSLRLDVEYSMINDTQICRRHSNRFVHDNASYMLVVVLRGTNEWTNHLV